MGLNSREGDVSRVVLGSESSKLDEVLGQKIGPSTRDDIWHSARNILDRGPISGGFSGATGLALGYVQSGKTTSITALIAMAADEGYRIVIALLGVTNLLLDQNRRRIEESLGLPTRNDFQWVVEANPAGRQTTAQIQDWLDRGRTVFIPVLKHAGRIDKLTEVLAGLEIDGAPVLIIDDDADQTSLNTDNSSSTRQLSRTYEAITGLRRQVPNNIFVQYTATPYAPLLIDPDDHLLPEFVEFLHPGPGYTGGREFFVDYAQQVVRDIPALEEQSTQVPLELPRSLMKALGSFIAGATLLLANDPEGSPVSMLVHSTHRNDIQARYHFLLDRVVRKWRAESAGAASIHDLPVEIQEERKHLVHLGAADIEDDEFLQQVKFVLREVVLWLVNSAAAVNRVDWNVAPIHILVGGNKLDRGFTVEGLTVTYMNRKPSEQIDTLEQRARAFGYRGDQLSYCQFFASHRTVKILRDVVYTEYDLRGRLQDHIAAGGTVDSWAREIGLLVPSGTKPTRSSVVRALSTTSPGWHSLRRPSYDADSIASNRQLVEGLGLYSAPKVSQGRLEFRTIYLPIDELIAHLFENWATDSYSPDWRRDDIMSVLQFSSRHPLRDQLVPVMLMEDDGRARTRKWDAETGFVNLFQGRDVNPKPGQDFYPGDRNIEDLESEPDKIVVQVHRLVRTEIPNDLEVLTLAVHLGERPIIRANSTKHIVESEIL